MSFDLFDWLPNEPKAALEAVGRRRSFSAGRVIYCQDEPGRDVYRVAAGAVRLSVIRSSGREFLFGIFGEGEIFGEGTVIDGDRRPNTATAHTDVELDLFSASDFARVRERYREIDAALVQMLARRMRVLAQTCAMANVDDLAHRIVLKLLSSAESTPNHMEDEAQTFPLTQSDLALMLGVTRQAVNRVLHQFQQKGIVALSYGQIRVHNMAKLKDSVTQH